MNWSQGSITTSVHAERSHEEAVVDKRILSTRHWNTHATEKLAPKILQGIKKFVFFVGYARSGHSIIGTLMDSHPHVVISNEFFIFRKFSELNRARNSTWRNHLFNLLYRKSVRDAGKSRDNEKKGYALGVKGLWQGQFKDYIEVIGDKSGGMTTLNYLGAREEFVRNYRKLKEKVAVPIRIIHALRNPFDIISTKVIAAETDFQVFDNNNNNNTNAQSRWSDVPKLDHLKENRQEKGIYAMFRQMDAVVEMIDEVFGKENVLEVHNCDLVADPRGTLVKIFRFLEVDTTEHFLDVCTAKVFKSVSRSRDLIRWSPVLREMVERKMKQYPMLSRYNFTSD